MCFCDSAIIISVYGIMLINYYIIKVRGSLPKIRRRNIIRMYTSF